MIVFHHLVVMEPLVLMDLVHILASALWGIQDETVRLVVLLKAVQHHLMAKRVM